MKKGIDYTGITIVFFCHDLHGNFLLHKRSQNCRDEHGRWDPGSGSLDFGETVDQALKRELYEEYKVVPQHYTFLGYHDVLRGQIAQTTQTTHWVALLFKVQVDRSQVQNGEPHKFDELQWFKLDALPTPLHSQFAAVLQKIEKQLIK